MVHVSPSPRRVLAACLIGLAGAGCHDAPTDPLATLVTPETAPALEVEIALPTLPDLAARSGAEAQVSDAVLAWMESWNTARADGSSERRAAVARAAPVIATALGHGGVNQALAPLFQVSRSLAELSPAPRELEPMLSEVGAGARAARIALNEGRAEDALREGLWASDRLRAASPEQVARALLVRGEQALHQTTEGGPTADGRSDRADQVGGIDRRRGALLLERARQALEAGDYTRAVQRAFYACQLLEETG
jgi:hypothetical protein